MSYVPKLLPLRCYQCNERREHKIERKGSTLFVGMAGVREFTRYRVLRSLGGRKELRGGSEGVGLLNENMAGL